MSFVPCLTMLDLPFCRGPPLECPKSASKIQLAARLGQEFSLSSFCMHQIGAHSQYEGSDPNG